MANNLRIFLVLAGVAVVSWLRYHAAPSPDLLATWMAGKYFADGNFAQIYANDVGVFTMRPPSEWVPYLRETGYTGSVYPFIYPPIWAYFGALLNRLTDFATLVSVASIINPLLLGAAMILAVRMVAEKLTVLTSAAIVIILFATSLPTLVALEQNQPQIMVTFLVVLGVERARAGSYLLGGLAMALAASIKLYPAIFTVFWWAQGDRRASVAFAIFGGGLGLLSLSLTGWPLHAEFLSQVNLISGSVLVTFFTYSLDPLIAQMFFFNDMTFITHNRVLASGEIAPGYSVMAKPIVWRAADVVILAATVGGLYLVAKSARGRDPLFWPFAFVLVALISPLSWGYHYLAALAFSTALLERYSLRMAVLALVVVFFPLSVIFLTMDGLVPWAATVQPLATFAMAIYAAILWYAMRKQT